MKKQYRFRQAAGALLVPLALTMLTQSASAIPLTWLGGPEAGQAFAGGGIVIKAFNFDTGTLYNGIPVGTSIGFSGSPGAGVAGGEATLNLPANVFRPALGANPATEDSWGIVKITQIQAVASNGTLQSIYNLDSSPFELTAMFWGIRDFHLTQVSPGSGSAFAGQVIDGVGMRVDVYSDFSKDFNETLGPGGRTGISSYTSATNGTLELSLLSTPGFINANGTFGGSATEFQSNTADVGVAALNVIGGASAAQFDTNGIGFGGTRGPGIVAGVAGQATTDIWLAFTSTPGTNGWDVNSNDPMLANISTGQVPDSGSTLVMLGLGLVSLGLGYRLRRKA